MADVTTTNTNEAIDYQVEYEKLQGELAKVKSSNDKLSSENAEYKRKDRERMSDEAKLKADQEERDAYYKGLERQLALRDYADELDDVTDKATQTQIVELLADGKIKEALTKFKQFRAKEKTEIEKRIKAELLKQNPQPSAQLSGGGYKSKAEILAIKDVQERQKAIAENINLFQ